MPDETVAALQEIASLLRQRVEQHNIMAKRSEERMEKFDQQKTAIPDLKESHKDFERRMEERHKEAEQRRQEEQAQKQRLQEEERQFKQHLLTELGRHNDLLEQIVSRLSR